MNKLTSTVALAVFSVSILACSSVQRESIPSGTAYDSSVYSDVRTVGAYHVAGFAHRRSGKVGVQILDASQRPLYLNEERLKARIEFADGSTETFFLRGEGYVPTIELFDPTARDAPGRATVYSKVVDRVRERFASGMVVWGPLPDGQTHEMIFRFEAADVASSARESRER